VKELGLTGKITPDQVAKKWDNLKTKFKVTTPTCFTCCSREATPPRDSWYCVCVCVCVCASRT